MFCRSLSLILLVLTCLQSFSEANDGYGPSECCFTYWEKEIPEKRVRSYTTTPIDCPKPGAFFISHKDQKVCVDTRLDWVKNIMKKLDQRPIYELSNEDQHLSPIYTQSDGYKPSECCFAYSKNKIAEKHVRSYTTTPTDCPKPGAVFISNKDQKVCVDTRLDWVKIIMKKLDQHQIYELSSEDQHLCPI